MRPDDDHKQAALRSRICGAVEARRAALKMEPVELARRSETDLSQLSKLLRGQAGASVYALERIAGALDWTLVDLFTAVAARRRSRRTKH